MDIFSLTGDRLTRTELVLLCLEIKNNRYMHVPELYTVLGDKLGDFIHTFEGLKLAVPTWKEIKDINSKIDIFLRLDKTPYGKRHYMKVSLAAKYGVSTDTIDAYYKEIRNALRILEHGREDEGRSDLPDFEDIRNRR